MTPLDRPSDIEIRAARDGILSSAAFSRSERLRAFLSYVVDKDLAGQSLQLKGYTIAVDVFGRSDAFNADSDPLVRVHAGKLRKLLAVYHETEGKDAPWRIEIPKGGYAPVYVRRPLTALPEAHQAAMPQMPADAPDTDAPSSDLPSPRNAAQLEDPRPAAPTPPPGRPAPPRPRKPGWMPAPFTSPIAMLSILPLLLFAPLSSTALGINPQIQARLSLATRQADVDLPIVSIRAEGDATSPAAVLAEQIRRAMDYYTVIVPAAAPAAAGAAASTQPSLFFTISIAPAAEADKTAVTVTSDATGDVISVSTIENENLSNEIDLLFESLAIAAKTLATNGDLFHYANVKGLASPLMRCMSITDTYRREKSREALKKARACQADLLGGPKGEQEFAISASDLKKSLHP